MAELTAAVHKHMSGEWRIACAAEDMPTLSVPPRHISILPSPATPIAHYTYIVDSFGTSTLEQSSTLSVAAITQ